MLRASPNNFCSPGAKSEGNISSPSGMPEYAFDSAVLENANSYPVDENPYNAYRGSNSNQVKPIDRRNWDRFIAEGLEQIATDFESKVK